MAKITQCKQCRFYNKSASLCYKNWSMIEHDNQECNLFLVTSDCLQQGLHETLEQDSITSFKNAENQPDGENIIDTNIQNQKKKRHWMVSLWLYFGTFVDIILLIFLMLLLTTDGVSVLKLGLLFDLSVNLIARILLFKWNNLGYYIIKYFVLTCGLVYFIELIFYGSTSINWSSAIIGYAVMFFIFRRKTSDGLCFFDNIGIKIRNK